MCEHYTKVVQAAFERPQESFETTCPVLGTKVTRYAKTGDAIRVKDANGCWYCVADSVRSLLQEPLTEAAKAHVRAWLHREWRSGDQMSDDRLRRGAGGDGGRVWRNRYSMTRRCLPR